MAKQLNVSLSFNANTSQAKQAIQDLQSSLSKISSMKVGNNLQLKEASEAAKMLSYHLNQAYNTTTGNIDLSALNHSLQKSSTNVTQLSNKLLQAGTTGQQAFVNLAQAISTAEYPMFKLGKRLTEFGNTLKNTIRWQFSSSVIHGMMGAYQQAIGYAERLNESLTNIRVVTGNSVEEMAKFAEYANKAAKSLSTTTTAYTDAALIFYQQGLGDQEVKERTDISVKMANVTGQSVSTVSDQLTAIWNNFNREGDVALEHYADVLTALGAATASSTDEIAGGLEKFAAIGSTIGLSYEYAAAALATITANTRESEDVVGTALKTIFARIQGLSLGETLEDGTDLNKYSEALKTVGIDIFDVTGELKNMDTILDEMGARWQTLAKNEQIALAQSVAGVRQYNQLMALMDNWNAGDSDSMLANLNTAYNADGALQEQADIWAESWEAARNRVKAAAEGVYDSILDDKMFIGFNNVFADMLTGVEQVIDGVGGLKGVFIGVGSFVLSLISHKIQPALTSFMLNIKSMFTDAQTQAAALTGQLQAKVSTELNKTGDQAYDASQKQALSNANTLAEARTRLTLVSKNLTEQEKSLYQFDISLMEADAKKAQAVADSVAALEKERDAIYMSVDATQEKILINETYEKELQSLLETQEMNRQLFEAAYAKPNNQQEQKEAGDEYLAARQSVDEYVASYETLHEIISSTTQATMTAYEAQDKNNTEFIEGSQVLEGFVSNLSNMTTGMTKVNRALKPDEIDSYKRQLDLLGKTLSNMKGISADTQKELSQLFAKTKSSKGTTAFQNNIEKIIQKLNSLKFTSKQLKDLGISLSPSQFKKFISNLEDGKKKEKELIAIQDELNNKMNNFNPSHMIGGLERLTSAASAMGSMAMMGQSISSMIDSWSNADLSFGEKLSTTFMSLSMLIPGTISAVKGLNTVLQGTALQQNLVSAAMKLTTKDTEIAAAKTILLTKAKGASLTKEQQEVVTKGVLAAALAAEKVALDANIATEVKEKIVSMVLAGAKKEEFIAYLTNTAGIRADTAEKIANKLVTDSLKTSIMGLVAAVTVAIAIFNAWKKAQEEAAQWEAEQNQEAVDQIMERVDALKTERQEFESLMKAYEDAKANQDGTAAAQQAIADATWDICEALGIEIDLIDKLQGKTSGYDKEIYTKAAQEALDNIKSFQTAWNDIDKNFYTQYRDVVDVIKPDQYTSGGDTGTYALGSISKSFWDENGVAYTPDYGYAAGGLLDKQDTAFREAFAKYLSSSDFKYADKMDFSKNMILEKSEGIMQFKGGVSVEEQYEIISEMVKYLSTQLSVDVQKNSEMFRWYESIVKAGKDTLADKNSATSEVEAQIQAYAKNQTQADMEMSYDQVKTYEEYLAIRDEFVKNLREGYSEAGLDIDYTGFETAEEYLESIAEKVLLAEPAIAKIKGIDEIARENLNLKKEDLELLYADYKDVFFHASIDFDEITSIEQLRNILASLQAEADAKSIQTKVTLVDNAKDNLKKDMSYSDYIDFEASSGIKWGQYDEDLKQNILDYTSFLQMTYDEQVAYLNSVQKLYQAEQAKTLSINANSSQTLLDSYANEYNALNEKITNNEEANRRALALLNQIKDLENEMSNTPVNTKDYDIKRNELNDYKAQHRALVNEYGVDNILSEADVDRMFELEDLIWSTQAGLNTLDAQLKMVVSDILLSATSVAELEAVTTNLIKNNVSVDYGIYAEALVRLASEYDNCTNEIKEFEAALLGSDIELKIAKQEALEAAIAIGEAAKEYGVAADTVEDVADAFEALADSSEDKYAILKEDGEALADASVRYVRLNEAVLDLADNYDDYKKVLKDVRDASGNLDKAMAANSKSGKALQKSLADLLGTSEDFINADLLDAIDPADFEAAAKGDEKAIERIRDAFIELQAAANDIDVSKLKEELAELEEGVVIDISAETQPFLFALLQAEINAGATAADIEALLSGFNIDADVSDFVGSMDEMVAASADAATQVIANTSYSQEVEPTTVETPAVEESVAEVSYDESSFANPNKD